MTVTQKPPRTAIPAGGGNGNGRSPRRRESMRPLHVALIGAAFVAALAVAVVVAARSSNGLPFVNYKTIYANVPDPGNLAPHGDVRLDGVRIGQVIKLSPAGSRARVELQLSPGAGPIPRDSRVRVRGAGLLGQRYVQIVPGRSSENLPAGGELRGGPRALTYGVPDVLDTFDRETRGALGDALNGLGVGLRRRGADISDAVRTGPEAARDFRTLVAAALEREGAARRLLPSLNSGAQAFEGASDDIARSLNPGTRALRPFIEQRDAFRQTFDEMPPTLSVAQPALEEGRALLGAVGRLAVAARGTLPPAPAGLRSTTALLRASPRSLRRATALLREAKPAIPAALKILDAVPPLIPPLRTSLTNARPLVTQLGAHGCDIVNIASNWHSTLGLSVSTGKGKKLPSGYIGPLGIFRITAIAGLTSVAGVAPLGTHLQADPYPAPCKFAPGPAYIAPSIPGRR